MNHSNAPNNKAPDISFCLPVYNVENFLSACIESIVSQDDGSFTYEIICVDDCSTDNTTAVLEDLSKTYPMIRIVKNEANSGVSYTRNQAVLNARGKYIWFVDPDDMLYPNAVSKMYAEAVSSDSKVILGNYITCTEDAVIKDFCTSSNHPTSFKILPAEGDVFLPESETGIRMCACVSGMFKRDFLTENNLRFNENMIAQEDTLFYYQFSLRLESVTKYDGCCYIYRQRSSSVMHTKSPERSKKYYHSMRTMHEVYCEHLRKGDYKNKEVLLKKIHHMKQNITVCLAITPDTAFVKTQLKEIKHKKIYPYKFRKDALKTKESLLRRLLFFLQPVEPFFWLLHLSGKISK